MSINNKEKYQLLNFQRNIQNISEIYSIFERNKISPVLIKGLAASINYPEPFQRTFSDIDLAVSKENFDLSQKIIKQNNFNIDLHCGLRHLDTVAWSDLYDNSKIVKIANTQFRTLRPEDHLRVLCIHWLTDGGADRTRLWDIYFALQNSGENFDWIRFLNSVDKRRQLWLLTVLALAEEYFGLRLNNSIYKDYKERVYRSNLQVKREIEKQWSDDVRLIPLSRSLGTDGKLLKQIKKRIPPNLLQSIVDTESDMSEDYFYLIRIKSFFKRSKNVVRNFKED